ncbi:solute carrier family 15 member 4 [Elysia marginata]|uniref:Solute carrier family 15 member 4 n=1 Tax=Elysia marginata TaxID=1093978 RepID=A0AAV4FVF9_9GAST|nr:solute carrier family 15 member 4 [Elysia marginata]
MLRQGEMYDEERRRLLVAQENSNRQRAAGDASGSRRLILSTPRLNIVVARESTSSSNSSSQTPSPPGPTTSTTNSRLGYVGVVRTNQGGVHRPRPRVSNSKSSDYGTTERRPGSAPSTPGSDGDYALATNARRLSSNNGTTAPPVAVATNSTGWQTRLALLAILLAVTLERICFYALTGNLVLFLNKKPFLWESYHAMNALFLFYGVTYLMSIMGGWVADSFLGRFRTQVVCYLIYLSGYIVMPFLAEDSDIDTSAVSFNKSTPLKMPSICGRDARYQKDSGGNNPFADPCAWLVYTSLVIIAMGSGALRANMCPFGSDQLPRASQNIQLSFFNWYYWCINIGSFVGLGLLSYVEQQFSFRLAFMASASMLFASGLVFCMGRVFYTSRAPDGSILSNVFKILREAFKRWRQRRQIRQSAMPPPVITTEDSASTSTLLPSSPTSPYKPVHQSIHFLDYAKHQHGGVFHSSLVDDVKKLGMIITVFAVLIPYWIVYFQMQTTFFFQGLHMRLDFYGRLSKESVPWSNMSSSTPHWKYDFKNTTTADKPQVVAAWFSLFDAVFVIILLPLFDRVIYPRLNRAGCPFTFTKRILLGMVFAMAAMVVAGVVEHYRLKSFWPFPDLPCTNASIPQYIAGTKYDAADMSVFWQIPQYALIGMSEVFTSVACLQFAVSVSPRSMKGLITGIFYCFCGIGSFLGTSILASLAATKTWIYSHNYGNINCRLPCHQVKPAVWRHSCHLDYYFFSLACLAALAIILFLIVAQCYGLGSDRLVINVQSQVTQDEEEGRRRRRHVQIRPTSARTVNTMS